MNKLCNFLLAGLMVSATLVAPLAQACAQSAPEPAVVISIANMKDQMADVDYLVESAGFGQMKFMAKTMINQYIKGINPDAPAGIMMYFSEDSQEPDFLGFVPVSNLDDLLDTISGYAEVDEGDDFTTIITDDETELLIKEVDGNAFFSNKEEMFERMPSNPTELLAELPNKYNLAAQLFGQRIPEELRTQALDMIRDGYERQLEQLEEIEPMQAELQRKNFDFQMKQFASWLNETETLTLGMCADKEGESLFMDVEITALKDSELAERMNASAPSEPTMFSGFLMNDVTFSQNTCAGLHPEDAKEYSKMLEQLKESFIDGVNEDEEMDDDQLEILENVLGDFVEIGQETLAEGKIDTGAVLMLKEGDINMAAAVRLADPKKLEATVKESIGYAEEKLGEEIQVDLNSGSYKDVTFHQIVIQVPDDEEEARDIIGDQVIVILGIGSKAAYLSAGSNPLPLLKKAMDGGTSVEDMMQYNFHLAPVIRFAADMEGEAVLETMAEELEASGKDRMQVNSNAIKDGMKMRFDMQDGILALIKVGVEGMGGGFGGGDF